MDDYKKSEIDEKITKSFGKNDSVNTLLSIKLIEGHLRSVYPCKIDFKYPISVFVGGNGAGKTTLLTMVACSYHNNTSYCPPNIRIRKVNPQKERFYYTYSDFFTYSPQEQDGFGAVEIESIVSEKNNKNHRDIRKRKEKGRWNG